jgi:hypothetical protein
MVQIEQPSAEVVEALGLTRRTKKGRSKNGRRCEDCFFHRHMLCALDLDEPCSTFRPDEPVGLVPPRQPVLLIRDA